MTQDRPDETSDAVRTGEAIPLAEERVVVEKREVDRLVATVRLSTREEEVAVRETLRREQVDIERRPMDLLTDDLPQTREEDGLTIIPIVEEVLVRRFHVVEELHIRRRAEDVEVEQTATLRRQEARIDRADTDRGTVSPGPAVERGDA